MNKPHTKIEAFVKAVKEHKGVLVDSIIADSIQRSYERFSNDSEDKISHIDNLFHKSKEIQTRMVNKVALKDIGEMNKLFHGRESAMKKLAKLSGQASNVLADKIFKEVNHA